MPQFMMRYEADTQHRETPASVPRWCAAVPRRGIWHDQRRFPLFSGLSQSRRAKAKTPVVKIAKLTKRSVGSLRQKALKLGIRLGHRR